MSYSIILFSNLIFHFLKIIWTLKIFYNFSSCEIMIFHMVELNLFIFQIVKFYKIVNYSKLVNCYIIGFCLENWLIFEIRNFWNFVDSNFFVGRQNIEWSNVERPRFSDFNNTNIKITKDDFFNLENDKVSDIQQFRKFYNLEKWSNMLSIQVI